MFDGADMVRRSHTRRKARKNYDEGGVLDGVGFRVEEHNTLGRYTLVLSIAIQTTSTNIPHRHA